MHHRTLNVTIVYLTVSRLLLTSASFVSLCVAIPLTLPYHSFDCLAAEKFFYIVSPKDVVPLMEVLCM